MDIVENSVRAGSTNIAINVGIDEFSDKIIFDIIDNGCGMDEKTLANAQNPFYTSKSERQKKVGLGIPLFKQNAEWCNGSFLMTSQVNQGTSLHAEFQYHHIDRMPLGKVADTVVTCIIGHPETDFDIRFYRNQINGDALIFELSTPSIKEELGDIPINYPDVTQFLFQIFNDGIKNTKLEEV
ncbi:MAG: sensor histidine kinase [Candidatus Cloacimonetes bacterium]|nr:sensor histidine kinase [Candidatus Cloacimonadota bacterium]